LMGVLAAGCHRAAWSGDGAPAGPGPRAAAWGEGAPLPPPAAAPATVRYQLGGLTVILRRQRGPWAPAQAGGGEVAIQAWVQAGAADEPEELSGAAHVLEHML